MTRPRGVTPTDLVFAAYQVLVLAIVLARRARLDSWAWFAVAAVLALLLLPLLARLPATRAGSFVGSVYAAALTPLFYTQLGLINTETGLVLDQVVQRWEAAVFGGQISVTWHTAMPHALLSWVLHLCYGGYIGIVIAVLLFLALRRRREDFGHAGFQVALGFYVCYALFLLIPVAGPRYFFGTATGAAAEVLPARLVHQMLEGGSAWGTAFPSSHIVASWCAVASLWRPARRLALALWPVVVCLALGTVYGQFHYGVDALAGVVLAIGLIVAARPLREGLERRLGAARAPEPASG